MCIGPRAWALNGKAPKASQHIHNGKCEKKLNLLMGHRVPPIERPRQNRVCCWSHAIVEGVRRAPECDIDVALQSHTPFPHTFFHCAPSRMAHCVPKLWRNNSKEFSMKYLITSGAVLSVLTFGLTAGGCGDPGYDAPPPPPAKEQPTQQQPPTAPDDDPFGQPGTPGEPGQPGSPGAPGTP